MSGKEKKGAENDDGQVFTVFDDQEIPYATLNSALTRLAAILDRPLASKEYFPVVKLKKEHIDFMLKETFLSKAEVESLLTRTGGDLQEAIKLYLDSSLDKSFKF